MDLTKTATRKAAPGSTFGHRMAKVTGIQTVWLKALSVMTWWSTLSHLGHEAFPFYCARCHHDIEKTSLNHHTSQRD